MTAMHKEHNTKSLTEQKFMCSSIKKSLCPDVNLQQQLESCTSSVMKLNDINTEEFFSNDLHGLPVTTKSIQIPNIELVIKYKQKQHINFYSGILNIFLTANKVTTDIVTAHGLEILTESNKSMNDTVPKN
jgi:hypothetical protein